MLPSRAGDPWLRSPAIARHEWSPPTDVYETPTEWIIQVEIAGVSEEDLDLLVYQDTLVIQGSRRWREPREAVRLHSVEIAYGPFLVVFALPEMLPRSGIHAHYEQGFLRVHLPKEVTT